MDSSEDANFDIKFVPPSPPRSVHDDLSPFNIAEFDIGGPLVKSPPFAAPPTPSYNGSYFNSPFSQHSELSFNGEDFNLDLLQDLDMVGLQDYDPSEYDVPNAGLATGSSLLMFSPDADFPHFTAADANRTKGSPFDHSSPSDNGDEQPYDFTHTNNVSDNRGHSRASSVNRSPQHSPSPQPQSQDVTQSFGNISIHTPNWGTQPLPQLHPSPGQKAQSPPRLLMPEGILDSAQSIAHHQRSRSVSDDEAMLSTAIPKINAPEDSAMGGPSFHFVPPTPVTAAGEQRQGVPFQHTLTTLVQGGFLSAFYKKGSDPALLFILVSHHQISDKSSS